METKDIELKPCPFCGGQAELHHTKTWDYTVRCTSCKAKTRQHHENHVGAMMDWNNRAQGDEWCKGWVSGWNAQADLHEQAE